MYKNSWARISRNEICISPMWITMKKSASFLPKLLKMTHFSIILIWQYTTESILELIHYLNSLSEKKNRNYSLEWILNCVQMHNLPPPNILSSYIELHLPNYKVKILCDLFPISSFNLFITSRLLNDPTCIFEAVIFVGVMQPHLCKYWSACLKYITLWESNKQRRR